MKSKTWLSSTIQLTAIALMLVLPVPLLAQLPGIPAPAAAPAAESVADPLGRQTPSGAVFGFNLASRRNDLTTARQFLQLAPAQRASAESLSRELNELVDRYFSQPLTTLSTSQSGNVNDGLPLDRERIELTIDGKVFDLELVRINDAQAGRIWLFASDTLAQVPSLYRSAQGPWIEEVMPEALVKTTIVGVSLARWIAFVGSIALPVAVLWLLSLGILVAVRRSIDDPQRRTNFVAWYGRLRWLAVFVLASVIHLTLLRYLAFSLRFRFVYSRFVLVATVIALGWFIVRLLTLSFDQARVVALRRGESSISSLLMLAERVAKVIVTLVALFAILTIAGVDTSTALAGVGIGGIALALGAQKSVENLLGSVFLITDKALAVGDECRIADRVGRIEDITLRSVRLRTAEQTLLSIPAGVLSQSNIENFSTRNKILIQSILRLPHETTIEQLRSVLESVQQLLASHSRLEANTARIRLVSFGEKAIELELFAFVLTSDGAKFLEVREELLLRIAEIVKSSGTGFARPTEYLYVDDQEESRGRTAGGEVPDVTRSRRLG